MRKLHLRARGRHGRVPGSTAAAAAADPGPIQVSGQSAATSQQAAAASSATQINPRNKNISIRVLSPGNDGAVSQSNNAASSAAAGNLSSTNQSANQAAGGSGIQTSQQSAGTDQVAAALSARRSYDPSNTNVPIRVLSPGNDGSVTQSNNAASRADAGNAASTNQNGSQSQAGSSCGCSDGSAPIQTSDQSAATDQTAAALSAATQIDPSNTAVSVRVLSPGDGGSVTQSNNAASSAERRQPGRDEPERVAVAGSRLRLRRRPVQQAKQQAETEQGARRISGDPGRPVERRLAGSGLSPGSDGSVNQSNNAASSATSGNAQQRPRTATSPRPASRAAAATGSASRCSARSAETGQSSTALSAALQLFGATTRAAGAVARRRQQRLAGSGLEPGLGRQRRPVEQRRFVGDAGNRRRRRRTGRRVRPVRGSRRSASSQ